MSNDKEFDKVADYDRLLLANVKLHNKINSQQIIIEQKDEEIERLKKDNEKYKEALGTYANTHNWINGFFVTDNFYSEKEEGCELAKQALSEIDNE